MVDRRHLFDRRVPNTRDKGGRTTGRSRYIVPTAIAVTSLVGGGALYAYAPERFDTATSILALFRGLGGRGGDGTPPSGPSLPKFGIGEGLSNTDMFVGGAVVLTALALSLWYFARTNQHA